MKKATCVFLLILLAFALYFYKNTIALREVTRFSRVVQLFGYKETNHISIINSCLDNFPTNLECKIDVYYFTDLDKDQISSIANNQGRYTKTTQIIESQDLINIDINRK